MAKSRNLYIVTSMTGDVLLVTRNQKEALDYFRALCGQLDYKYDEWDTMVTGKVVRVLAVHYPAGIVIKYYLTSTEL